MVGCPTDAGIAPKACRDAAQNRRRGIEEPTITPRPSARLLPLVHLDAPPGYTRSCDLSRLGGGRHNSVLAPATPRWSQAPESRPLGCDPIQCRTARRMRPKGRQARSQVATRNGSIHDGGRAGGEGTASPIPRQKAKLQCDQNAPRQAHRSNQVFCTDALSSDIASRWQKPATRAQSSAAWRVRENRRPAANKHHPAGRRGS